MNFLVYDDDGFIDRCKPVIDTILINRGFSVRIPTPFFNIYFFKNA